MKYVVWWTKGDNPIDCRNVWSNYRENQAKYIAYIQPKMLAAHPETLK